MHQIILKVMASHLELHKIWTIIIFNKHIANMTFDS
jgi:hypothetical protein